MTAEAKLQLFTFSPAPGLPTSGPFGIKLEACLRMLDIPYERVYEDNIYKGPKRKSPWIVDGSLRMGDTELILEHLATTHKRRLDESLTPAQRASALILQRMLEEHYHQILEYELMVLDEGHALMRENAAKQMPALLVALVAPLVRRHFRKHLFERGIGRHSPEDIAALGRADIDALSDWLGEREWFIADEPSKADASALGLLAASIRSPLNTPMISYARSKANLVAFVERGMIRFFPDT